MLRVVAEAPPEVQEDAARAIIEEERVAADLADAAVSSEGDRHNDPSDDVALGALEMTPDVLRFQVDALVAPL